MVITEEIMAGAQAVGMSASTMKNGGLGRQLERYACLVEPIFRKRRSIGDGKELDRSF